MAYQERKIVDVEEIHDIAEDDFDIRLDPAEAERIRADVQAIVDKAYEITARRKPVSALIRERIGEHLGIVKKNKKTSGKTTQLRLPENK
jgi:ribosomal protein L11